MSRVLVCGTNYGRFYLDAAARRASAYRLAGILARGSDRSLRLARRFGVPLFCDVDEVPDGVDLACAAMSSSAGDVVLRLIERGIHVLCEHPQRTGFLRQALSRAEGCGVRFHVNGHFPDLPAPRAFIDQGSDLWQAEPPRFLDVTASDRALWGAVDIVARAARDLQPWEVECTGRASPFTILRGVVAGTSTTLRVQTTGGTDDRALEDGSPDYLLDCRVTAGFRTGVLTLMSLAGPVVWNRNASLLQGPDEDMWMTFPDGGEVTADELREQRILANLAAIDRLAEHVRTGVAPSEQAPEHLVGVAAAWEALGELLG